MNLNWTLFICHLGCQFAFLPKGIRVSWIHKPSPAVWYKRFFYAGPFWIWFFLFIITVEKLLTCYYHLVNFSSYKCFILKLKFSILISNLCLSIYIFDGNQTIRKFSSKVKYRVLLTLNIAHPSLYYVMYYCRDLV